MDRISMIVKKTSGRLILEEVAFSQMYERKVGKNNNSSGKVTLPAELIGKKVYVVVEPED